MCGRSFIVPEELFLRIHYHPERKFFNCYLIIDYQNRLSYLPAIMEKLSERHATILSVLEAQDRPVTPKELLEVASTQSPSLGLATVYRALKVLVETGQARKIEVAGLAPHYERNKKEHHHFFVCEDCKRIFDLYGCSGGLKELLPSGFTMTSHELTIFGACRDCRP